MGAPICERCLLGMNCDGEGNSLSSVELDCGFWRYSDSARDVLECVEGGCDACIGGANDVCADWLSGPFCSQCNISDGSRYFDTDQRACRPCSEIGNNANAWLLLAACGLLIVLAAAVLLWSRYGQALGACSATLQHFITHTIIASRELSLVPKLKQLIGFAQVVTRLSSVCTPLPAS